MKPIRNGRDRGIHGTRRERAARVRRDLVHAAGECWTHRGCIVTSFFAEPSEALLLEREAISDGYGPFESLALMRAGAVRVPRTLKSKWQTALGQEQQRADRRAEFLRLLSDARELECGLLAGSPNRITSANEDSRQRQLESNLDFFCDTVDV